MGGRRLAGLVVLAMLWGCGASRAYKEGLDLEAAGKLPAAAARYLDALDKRPTHPDALVALAGIAEEAWTARLGQARDAETRKDFVVARDRYRELARFEERLDRHGFLDFDRPVDAKAKAKEMEEGAADRAYVEAERLRAAGQFETAIANYREAQGFVAGYRDSQAKIAASYLDWGAAEGVAGRWRAAWGRYVDASLAGAPEGKTRAAEVALALGRWHFLNGACRQAVRDLVEADGLVPGAARADLEQARSCAEVRVAVVVDPLAARDVATLGFDPAGRLGSGLVERIPGATSDFVVVVAASALDGPERDARGRLAVDRILGARLTRWDVEPLVRQALPRRATAEADVPCTDPATGEARTCVVPFDLVYTEVTEGKVASLSVTASVVAYTGSKVLATKTFDLGARSDATWAADLRDGVTGESVWPTRAGATAVRIPPDVTELVDAPRALTTDNALFATVTDEVAVAVTTWAAGFLDADPPTTDPTALKIQPLPALR